MWKLSIGVIAEEMHNFEQEKTNSEEQEGCRRGSRGTNNQLLIDKTVVKVARKGTPIGEPIRKRMTLFRIAISMNVRSHLELQITREVFWKEQRAVEVIADF